MAAKYHINGDSVSPCRAEQGRCPFGQGPEENHFDNAGDAMKVLEERLEQEHGGANAPSVSKTKKPKTAAELAKEGAPDKEVRDALRRENPTWKDAQVHTVQGRMSAQPSGKGTKASSKGKKVAPAKPKVSDAEVAVHLDMLKQSEAELRTREAELTQYRREVREYNRKHGHTEGRAFYYDYKQPGGKVYGMNPNGATYYTDRPETRQKINDLNEKVKEARRNAEDAQTAVEESGHGHLISDEGNTIRVNTQAQKHLLENELKGQISDGMWENTKGNPWEDWSGAKVIVDPNNPGRNFHTTKDNYNLNSTKLLEVVGDRMVDDVKTRTGEDYDDKKMVEDLRDLKKVFKTQRPPRVLN